MSNERISVERILNKLDSYLHRNDYVSAEKHLLYWLDESEKCSDSRAVLAVMNELMGLYRKLGNRVEALRFSQLSVKKIEELNAVDQLGSATVYLNCATVYKAFGMAKVGMPLFRKAEEIYKKNLSPTDSMWGGLYNNMALALVDIKEFSQADAMYRKAIDIMLSAENGEPEAAITYLNLANAIEEEKGLLDGSEEIDDCLHKAKELLENYGRRDGNYAFVCEKCASVFGYYGDFLYEQELKERAERIYNNERS